VEERKEEKIRTHLPNKQWYEGYDKINWGDTDTDTKQTQLEDAIEAVRGLIDDRDKVMALMSNR